MVMKIKRTSYFKDEKNDKAYFENWVKKLELLNGKVYQKIEIETSIGKTIVWGLNLENKNKNSLVIFPGFRTTPLIWDLDNGLNAINSSTAIYLVETNGQPNLSDGSTPDIKSLDYGHWANEVLEKLEIEKTFVAGASFGGLICMKLGITHPEKIKAAFLLNPGCLQNVSLNLKDLYYLVLPVLSPKEKNIITFLNKSIFCKPTHQISNEAEKLLIDYELFALTKYKDKTQKPYFMKAELEKVKVATYLLEGTKDPLFPYEKSIANAKKYIKTLKEVKIFENVGHGIETYREALNYIGNKIVEHK